MGRREEGRKKGEKEKEGTGGREGAEAGRQRQTRRCAGLISLNLILRGPWRGLGRSGAREDLVPHRAPWS